MKVQFNGTIFTWRGSSPYFFVTVPTDESDYLKSISATVTYDWGMIPVTAQVGGTVWTTSLFPKYGRYLLPLEDKVPKAERLVEGAEMLVRLEVPG